MNKALLSSLKMDWRTPKDFFQKLDQEFHFGLDAAASPENAKCERYFTPEMDGLSCSWSGYGAVFCNPPYGREIGKWVQKAYSEHVRIMWWQDGEMHVGLGSANLSFVRKWLSEEFEVDSPAADVEPVRHGNWNIRRPRRSALCLVCSVCGRKVDTDAIGILLEAGEYGVVRRLYPYCHCGAKMDLEE